MKFMKFELHNYGKGWTKQQDWRNDRTGRKAVECDDVVDRRYVLRRCRAEHDIVHSFVATDNGNREWHALLRFQCNQV